MVGFEPGSAIWAITKSFRDCLGFKDFKNFGGVCFPYKGVRIVAFKLKEAIDVDKQIEFQCKKQML